MLFLPWLRSQITGIGMGLLPHVEDERDFSFGATFGAAQYQPKHLVHEIKTLSVRNQNPLNTCVWNSATVCKEVAEGRRLSVRFLVSAARQKGRLTGNGFASLRDAQQTLVDTGICDDEMLPDAQLAWDQYSSPANVTSDRAASAQYHRAKSYFAVRTKEEMLKALDDGYPVHTGMTWRTGYRSPAAPYVLNVGSGSVITGHAFVLKGYDLQRNLWKFQNSFGALWGDKGDFYVRMADWNGFTGYVSVDMPLTGVAAAYEGKDVKSAASPAIYRVQDGKRRPFLSEKSYFAAGGRFDPNRTWVLVADSVIQALPLGEPMP